MSLIELCEVHFAISSSVLLIRTILRGLATSVGGCVKSMTDDERDEIPERDEMLDVDESDGCSMGTLGGSFSAVCFVVGVGTGIIPSTGSLFGTFRSLDDEEEELVLLSF